MFFCDRPLNSGWLSGRSQFGGIVELDYGEQVKILGFRMAERARSWSLPIWPAVRTSKFEIFFCLALTLLYREE
jgi:hypothetical protein